MSTSCARTKETKVIASTDGSNTAAQVDSSWVKAYIQMWYMYSGTIRYYSYKDDQKLPFNCMEVGEVVRVYAEKQRK